MQRDWAALREFCRELLIPPPGLDKDAREALEALLALGGQPVRIRNFDEVELNQS